MMRNWYFRLLFSYFPILVLAFSIIIFLSYIVVNETTRKETKKADGIATGYTIDRVERAVREIEMTILNEAAKNPNFTLYMNRSTDLEVKYAVVRSLRAIMEDNKLIHSVYVYRRADGTILTDYGQSELSSFGDRAFIGQAWNNLEYRGWSPSREYRESEIAQPAAVISMYKRAPLPFGDDGLIVINVDLYEIEKMIGGMTNRQLSFMRVRDAAGQLVYPPDDGDDAAAEGKVLTTARSERLGWTFESGIQAGQLFGWVSVISYVWVAIASLTFAAAIVYLIWITKRNYKPIRLMVNRIQTLQLRNEGTGRELDDLAVIDRALEKLIDQARDYEKEKRESAAIQRRQLFLDLIAGERGRHIGERLSKLNPLPEKERYAVAIARLEQYESFQSDYSPGEQNLMKYALGNVMQELALSEELYAWGEWAAPDRIAFILAADGDAASVKTRLRRTASVARAWMEERLRIPLSFGIGSVVDGWRGLHEAYCAALTAMDHQLSIGRDAVATSDDLPNGAQREMYKYMQLCTECVQKFRLTDETWREKLELLFRQLEADAPRDEDIHSLLRLLLQLLGRELKELSGNLGGHFEGEQAELWRSRFAYAPSLREMKALLLEYLNEIYRTYVAISETKSYKAMIAEMRAYIQENFANPDLSLKHLSDRFQISGKYASYLFKLEYDMKFVDYLVRLRMQHAERLLAYGDDTIQDIALKVGYANSITFGRVFKRTVGVTPSDYRRLKMRPSAPQ
ncbi:AraC family transcriptional regulator [Paenibacillus sp. 32O-W]|nr:helix-turn-helix domain-containing protein [Paenibacillus sp. 32O-W]ALS26331.1 AraC family transcriptional regulator [Paenibacillus sp. 32O-W]